MSRLNASAGLIPTVSNGSAHAARRARARRCIASGAGSSWACSSAVQLDVSRFLQLLQFEVVGRIVPDPKPVRIRDRLDRRDRGVEDDRVVGPHVVAAPVQPVGHGRLAGLRRRAKRDDAVLREHGARVKDLRSRAPEAPSAAPLAGRRPRSDPGRPRRAPSPERRRRRRRRIPEAVAGDPGQLHPPLGTVCVTVRPDRAVDDYAAHVPPDRPRPTAACGIEPRSRTIVSFNALIGRDRARARVGGAPNGQGPKA